MVKNKLYNFDNAVMQSLHKHLQTVHLTDFDIIVVIKYF